MDHDDLESLRQRHPAWRLLRADSAPFIASTLHRVFIDGAARTISEDALLEAVDDELFQLRHNDAATYPRTAKQYVTDWADPARGWLRKFYPAGSDTPSYDLTPSTEKALAWLDSLAQRAFVGTESRLMTLFVLLQQIIEGTQEDPEQRLAALRRRRAEIDAEIERVQRGDVPLLDDTAVRDRFQQFSATARDLLSDFREVEENFRLLDRGVREQIATWDGARGALLDDVFGEHDAIAASDQGTSFQAFWDFLMSGDRQEAFGRMLEEVMTMPALGGPDPRLRFVVHDWLKAADAVQATVARLSEQLGRFLDDRAYLENRRIAGLTRSIEASALALRDRQPTGDVAELDHPKASVSLPMSRRLYAPARAITLVTGPVDAGDEEFDADALFTQFTVDTERLRAQIVRAMSGQGQASLADVVRRYPVTQGLAEVVSYLALADADRAVFDDEQRQSVAWEDASVDLPLVVFTEETNG